MVKDFAKSMECRGRHMDEIQRHSNREYATEDAAREQFEQVAAAYYIAQAALRSGFVSKQQRGGMETSKSGAQHHSLINEFNDAGVNVIGLQYQLESSVQPQAISSHH